MVLVLCVLCSCVLLTRNGRLVLRATGQQVLSTYYVRAALSCSLAYTYDRNCSGTERKVTLLLLVLVLRLKVTP